MDYKNFFLRSIFSIIFILFYYIISITNFYLVYILILLIYIIIFIEVFYNFKKNKFFPILYISLSLAFFLMTDFNNRNYLIFNLFIIVVIIFDIFSYLIGKLFGKTKLIKISPNKTVEGLLGGFIFSFISSLIFLFIFDLIINTKLILFIIIIILFSFFGDIIESFYKRKNNLKNSSEFIPGHGGVFDRFDSFLFAIIPYSIFTNILL